MLQDEDFLKVGDTVEFHCRGNPKPPREWDPQIVKEIRIVEEYESKEGQTVPKVSWQAIADFECLVVVLGSENWGRNLDIRPPTDSPTAARIRYSPHTFKPG